jgi:hypothetical protein
VDELAINYPIKAILGTRFACVLPNPKPNIQCSL